MVFYICIKYDVNVIVDTRIIDKPHTFSFDLFDDDSLAHDGAVTLYFRASITLCGIFASVFTEFETT